MRRILLTVSVFVAGAFLGTAYGQSLSGLIFVIDPGHGGFESDDRHIIPDPGTDFWESEGNFRKALHLKPLLEQQGATVYLTRNGNTDPELDDPSLTARWQLANSVNANWFHSIHSNAAGGTNTSINRTMVLIKENIATRQPAFPEAVTMSSYIYNHKPILLFGLFHEREGLPHGVVRQEVAHQTGLQEKETPAGLQLHVRFPLCQRSDQGHQRPCGYARV